MVVKRVDAWVPDDPVVIVVGEPADRDRPRDREPARTHRPPWGVAGVITVLLVALCGASQGGTAQPFRPELAACVSHGRPAHCGTMTVYEDRAAMSGPTIDLSVVVIPGRGADRRPDPIFFLTGGPGGAATIDFAGVASQLPANRDVVLMDQRGTGGSNELLCPISAAAAGSVDRADEIQELRDCLTDLDADPRAYTTAWAMDDLDDLRAALGYRTINLFGSSYGATAIQVYLQRHPDRARTATMLGGTPLDVPIAERLPRNSQRAFDLLVERCRADARCRAAYPDLPGDLAAVTAALDRGPVELPQRVNGEPLRVTRDGLGLWVNYQLLGTGRATRLPRLLHAASRGDWRGIGADVAALTRQATEPAWHLMNLTIMCHEPWARVSRARTEQSSAGSYLSYADARAWVAPEQACAATPRPPAAAIYQPPAEVPVPVLFINGEADPQNPPANVAAAAEHYPASRVLVAPGQSHQEDTAGFRLCLEAIIAGFLDAGSAGAAPARCLEDLAAPPIQLP